MSTTMLKKDLGTGDLCDNIGLVGVSAKWSYVTAGYGYGRSRGHLMKTCEHVLEHSMYYSCSQKREK